MQTCVFDIDGTIRPPAAGKSPTPPPRDLAKILHGIRKHGKGTCLLVVATGASRKSTRQTEIDLNFRLDWVSPSYCGKLIRRGGHTPSQLFLAPPTERRALRLITPKLDHVCQRHQGKLDDRDECYTMFLANKHAFEEAREEVTHLVTPVKQLLRFTANPHDGGISVMPYSAGKHLLVDYLWQQSITVSIGAGDTLSDKALLERCEYPILTRTCKDADPPDPILVEIVTRKRGYIAHEDEFHGHGLIAGLEAARRAGVVSF